MENLNYDISVIVPVYNVEEYLKACLDSLLVQGDVKLEVIMVDDGSTDSSGEIAENYAKKYSNFHCYHIENGGLGHARNYAVPFAVGKYIAFVDSDDVIPKNTYEKMLKMAQRDGSDLTICNVYRFNSKRIWNSEHHAKLFQKIEGTTTHITKEPLLFYDTTSWNKVILREFYLKHNFQFPENILFEDIPVTIPMHHMANQVSVLNNVGYLWRVREGTNTSITQNNRNMTNFADRMKILEMLDDFYDKNVSDKNAHRIKQIKTLEVDLMIFLNELPNVSAEQAHDILRTIKEYIRKRIDSDILSELSPISRQKYVYVMNDNVEELCRLREFQLNKYGSVPLEEKDGRLFALLPEDLFIAKSPDVTREISESVPRKYIDDMTVENNGVITVTAHVYRQRVNISEGEQTAEAFLYNELTGYKIPLKTSLVSARKLTDSKGRMIDADSGKVSQYNYDGTGFKARIDLKEMEIPDDEFGMYKLLVKYKNRFGEGNTFIGGCDKGIKNACENTTTALGTTTATVYFSYQNELKIYIRKRSCFVDKVYVEEDSVFCRINGEASSLWLKRDKNWLELKRSDKENEFYISQSSIQRNKKYELYAETENEGRVYVYCAERSFSLIEVEDFAVVHSSVKTCASTLRLLSHISCITEFDRQKEAVRIRVRELGNAEFITSVTSARLCVDDKITESIVILAQAEPCLVNDRREYDFTVDFADENLKRDFYQSVRDVYIEYVLPEDTVYRERLYGQNFFSEKFLSETLEIKLYRGAEATCRLELKQLWKKSEDTQVKRQQIILNDYPKFRKEPIKENMIVFESMWGRKYSCNPQALYEYIDKNYPEYECVWSLNDARTPINGRGKRVRRGSKEYWRCMATAKYFVNNVNFQDEYVKREGQIEIQTMHGTPLKTLGLEVAADFPTESSRTQFIKKCSRWDYLIVEGKFMKNKAADVYSFNKKILKTGYPRTDSLYNISNEKITEIKSALGIPPDKKVILYAPTWRVKNKFDMKLDLNAMRLMLNDEYVILVRIHHLCGAGYKLAADNKFVFDVTKYNSIETLYQIADVLITDYSSVMFDFALLDKPMIFYTYDLEEYRDELRGMYVDITKEAPGPLVFTTKEVISAILNFEETEKKCKKKTKKFKSKFLTYENPNSCEMIVNKVFKKITVNKILKKIKANKVFKKITANKVFKKLLAVTDRRA